MNNKNKYHNKYRIESNRLRGWDYSNPGAYFITLCTQNRECHLGEIINEKMILSDFGKIVDNEWNKSFDMRDELLLDVYIIMPNHIHAIVVLNVEMHGRASLQSPKPSFIRQPKSISSFIGGFKSAANSKIDDYIDKHNLNIPKYNRKNHFFQPNYHDHIIRDEQSYENISNYIINNVVNWEKDELFQ